jgi:hypothetical protein
VNEAQSLYAMHASFHFNGKHPKISMDDQKVDLSGDGFDSGEFSRS